MSPRERPTRSNEPHDRLTRLGNEVLEALVEHPEYKEGLKAMVFLNQEGRGAIALHGYADGEHDEKDAIVDLFLHLQVMFAAIGKELQLMPIPNKPEFS